MEIVKKVLTEKEALERFTQLFREQDVLREDMKALQEESDEANLNVKAIKKLAGLIAKSKTDVFVEETGDVIALLDRVTNEA